MRLKFILNPTAGRGRGQTALELIKEVLDPAPVTYAVALTTRSGEAIELAQQAAQEDFDVIVAAGGDGTVNQVVNGLVGSNIPMAVLPCGTGNDFAAMIGMPKDLNACLHQIIQGNAVRIDLCKVNDRYFISSVGAGFDGQVTHTVNNNFKHLRGMAVYLLGVFSTIFSYKGHHVKLTVDGESREFDALLVAVNNSRTYGGGLNITPEALLDDGLFDICTARMMKPLEICKSLPRLLKGTHGKLEKINFCRGKYVELQSDTPIYYQVDGEVFRSTELKMEILHHAFPIFGAAGTPALPGIMAAAAAGDPS